MADRRGEKAPLLPDSGRDKSHTPRGGPTYTPRSLAGTEGDGTIGPWDSASQVPTQYCDPDGVYDPVDAEPDDEACCKGGLLPHGSIAGSTFNLAAATLGVATVGLPYAMYNAGFIIGTTILLVCFLFTVYSIRLLAIVFDQTEFKTYELMAKELVGAWFEKLTMFLIVVFCWGTTLSYLVVIGDVLEMMFNTIHNVPHFLTTIWGRRVLTSCFWLCFCLPLSLAKEINTLRYASLVGMAATFMLVIAIVVHSASPQSPESVTYSHQHNLPLRDRASNVQLAAASFGMIAAIPTFSFAYCCQVNVFEVYTELRPRTVGRLGIAAIASMGIATCVYIASGIAGAMDFGEHVHGNILKNYRPDLTKPYIAIAVICITITLTMAYPLCMFPTRDSILQLLGFESVYAVSTKVRFAVVVPLAFSSLVCGLFIPNVTVLFGILGGVCGASLGFIWPATFALRSGTWTVAERGRLDVVVTWALLIVGLVFGVLGTAVSIYNQIVPSGDSDAPSPPPSHNGTNVTNVTTMLASALFHGVAPLAGAP